MRIKVLFFGATADTAGTRETDIDVAENVTPKTVLKKISQEYPSLANHKLLIAVNEEYAPGDTPLSDGDEVAVFTTVSGG